MVQKTTLNIENSGTSFLLSDMLDVESALSEYSEAIYSQAVKFNEEKDQLASIWNDAQYKDFSEFVESVCKEIIDALKVFDEYRTTLADSHLLCGFCPDPDSFQAIAGTQTWKRQACISSEERRFFKAVQEA